MLCAPELRNTKGEDKDLGNPGESKKSKNVERGSNPQPVRMRLTADAEWEGMVWYGSLAACLIFAFDVVGIQEARDLASRQKMVWRGR